MNTGRPTKLTDATANRVVEAIERGNTRATAARLAGIGPSTLREWAVRGRAGEEPFAAFLARAEKADATAEDQAVRLIRDAAMGGTWTAAAWWLERRRPKRWGRRDRFIEAIGKLEARDAYERLSPLEKQAAIDRAQAKVDAAREALKRQEEGSA